MMLVLLKLMLLLLPTLLLLLRLVVMPQLLSKLMEVMFFNSQLLRMSMHSSVASKEGMVLGLCVSSYFGLQNKKMCVSFYFGRVF